MNESMDRVLADWLREGPESGPREGLERALAATRRVGQKPGWAFLERWLPMQLTMARTPSLRPILAVVMLALLIVALVATVLFVGSQRRRCRRRSVRPATARSSTAEDGDLFIADDLSSDARALVAGPDQRQLPGLREPGRPSRVRTGSGRRLPGHDCQSGRIRPYDAGRVPGRSRPMTWSPDGECPPRRATRSADYTGLQAAVVNADGSGLPCARRRHDADYASWRPDGRAHRVPRP